MGSNYEVINVGKRILLVDDEPLMLKGLKYTLEKGTLSSGFPLGVSNHFLGQEASVSVERGTLIALYDVENGFPLGG